MRVVKFKHLFPKAFHFRKSGLKLPKSLFPKAHSPHRYAVSRYTDLTSADLSLISIRPREKRNNRARLPAVIAEIKVIRTRIIEINRLFDQTKSKYPRVKIHVLLRMPDNRRDMMNTHGLLSH
ncbi:hypothetical protein D3C85_1410290 [compost metagenome]